VGAAPRDCVVIEDSIHGVEAARHAGMRCIVVGKLATDPDLAVRMATMPGPPLLPAPSLAELTWPVPDALWRA
jgi:beta-phosphoglucomutase-like phosphatase (HAD superfamily)